MTELREHILNQIQALPEAEVAKVEIFLAGLNAGASQIQQQEQPAEQAGDKEPANV